MIIETLLLEEHNSIETKIMVVSQLRPHFIWLLFIYVWFLDQPLHNHNRFTYLGLHQCWVPFSCRPIFVQNVITYNPGGKAISMFYLKTFDMVRFPDYIYITKTSIHIL